MELWRDVVGYEGLYQVSNKGRVRSVDRVVYDEFTHKSGVIVKRKRIFKGKILNLIKKPSGDKYYLTVMLSRNGGRSRYYVHQLVGKAFIPNPNNYPIINHINEDETWNNCVDNLEWCTYKYNNNYGTKVERMTNSLYNREDLSKKCGMYSLDGELLETFESCSEVERKYPKFKKRSVIRCCHKGHYLKGVWCPVYTYKGYVFNFI